MGTLQANRCEPRFRLSQRTCGFGARAGVSLIDVAAGAAILSLILIPALKLMGQTSQIVSDLNAKDAMLFEAERLLEETKISLCDPGRFASAGGVTDLPLPVTAGRSLRSQVNITPDAIDGLLTLDVIVYQDANRNTRPDANELSQRLRTQWCRP